MRAINSIVGIILVFLGALCFGLTGNLMFFVMSLVPGVYLCLPHDWCVLWMEESEVME